MEGSGTTGGSENGPEATRGCRTCPGILPHGGLRHPTGGRLGAGRSGAGCGNGWNPVGICRKDRGKSPENDGAGSMFPQRLPERNRWSSQGRRLGEVHALRAERDERVVDGAEGLVLAVDQQQDAAFGDLLLELAPDRVGQRRTGQRR